MCGAYLKSNTLLCGKGILYRLLSQATPIQKSKKYQYFNLLPERETNFRL
jgi:hypothetical protein